jgi:hypothetical protein
MFECVEAPPEEAPLSRCRPSGWLALELDVGLADPGAADESELIEAIVAFDRQVSWAQARQARLLAEFARRRPPDTDPGALRSSVATSCSEFAPDEVGLALRLSRMAAGSRLGTAVELDSVLPETLTAWEHGLIDAAKVRAITEACRHLSMELARAVQDRVLARAPEQTQGQLRAAVARAVIAVDPQGAEQRHREARRERRVVLNPEPEGMASLWALLPAPDAVAAYEHLGRLARGLGAADSRGMDARRADLLTELLTGRRCASQVCPSEDHAAQGCTTEGCATEGCASEGCASEGCATEGCATEGCDPHPSPTGETGGGHRRSAPPPKSSVHVTVPITTLMGLDDAPGELRGYGPIPATLAREIAADGTWRRLLTDPESGTLLDYGRTTYRPPVGLADHVRARDHHCRSPICRRSAAHADLDHTIAWADGGTTSEHNLYAGCRHDHRLKTHANGWQVTQDPNGTITYTTPTGHRYASRPHDYRPPPLDPDQPPF